LRLPDRHWSPKLPEIEFTGERVVPGLVDPDLFNEHLSRYRFAARFAARGARVLDAGCGTGYGTAEFGNETQVMAMDISEEAVAHATRGFGRPGVHFLQGGCEALPFADGSFDLVVAFEVIEHLDRWPDLLTEARRVLQSEGVLLVSTPNKAYYAEARAVAGPNPYHVREFEYREFECALKAVFPHVHLWSQNHSESIAFVPSSPSVGVLDAPADPMPEQAHFFLAACSRTPIADTRAFGWLPSSGNVLRERERHIALLNSELRQKEQWLSETQAHRTRVMTELQLSNAWAENLNAELKSAGGRITELQAEVVRSNAWAEGLNTELAAAGARIDELQRELAVRLDWVHDIEAQLDAARGEIARLAGLDVELEQAKSQLRMIGDSRWVRLGRKAGIGPVIDFPAEQ
jgi:ubiquinone/menaquinone biosynthesis C-methylase UbiE